MPVAYNEARRIGRVLDRFRAASVPHLDVVVVDDGSTDETAALVRARGVRVLSRAARGGAGAAIRTAYQWARTNGYDIAVILAGNDKDRPEEIERLIAPIVRGEADLVQGSRYLAGGVHGGTPLLRRIATQFVHPRLTSLAAGRRLTDTTNGYRALRLSVLDDERIGLNDPRLDRYQLEPYLLLTAIRLGYAVIEVPVSKIYPQDGHATTKMRPVVDWWRILEPVVRNLSAERFGRRA